jgi:hypothetical protein
MHLDIATNRVDRPLEQIEPAVNVADGVEPRIAIGNWRILRYDRPLGYGPCAAPQSMFSALPKIKTLSFS